MPCDCAAAALRRCAAPLRWAGSGWQRAPRARQGLRHPAAPAPGRCDRPGSPHRNPPRRPHYARAHPTACARPNAPGTAAAHARASGRARHRHSAPSRHSPRARASARSSAASGGWP
ncbi:hypothetical protein G6F50_015416 [Rhizopus delemar]|uniref:Uncharacterized protein n=1 Tax=Rhizopus delemar TaxID=936053 RepID=A0A9P6XYK1_9FUNG|nr:hypothetical protein G6F50_015416 [Rhizopus delemar]